MALPKEWRNQFEKEYFMIKCWQKQLVTTPISQEEVIFDAERDNDCKGVSVDEMIKTLKKISSRNEQTHKNL